MPPLTISPNLLGSSHWITNDIAGLGKVLDGLKNPDVSQSEIKPDDMPKIISSDAVFTSLAAGPKSAKVDSIVAGARLMGDKVKPLGVPVEQLHKPATQIAKKLGFDIDDLVGQVARLNRQYDPQANVDQMRLPPTQRELEAARVAVDKVLLSRDFMRLAVEDVSGKTFRDQGGLVALANTSLGVMKMIREGVISADSMTIDLVDGQVYDVAKPGDMLRLAVETGSKVREMFVDESKLKSILVAFRGDPSETALGRKIYELIAARREVTKQLDFSNLNASTEKEVDSRLNEARDALRSFRYDMDRHAGVEMSAGETLRRWADNHGSRKFLSVSQQAFAKIQALETDILNLLEGHEVRSTFRRSVMTYKDAAQLSHQTNTLIRHCRSGYAAEQQKFANKVHSIFDPLMKGGGEKTVYFEFGGTVRAGFDAPSGLKLDVNAKAGYRHKVSVKIDKGGGQVTVTTFDGGVAEGGVGFKFGHSANDWDSAKNKPGDIGWGAEANVKGNLSVMRAHVTKYPNLDEFIKAVGHQDMIVHEDSSMNVLGLNKIVAAVKWVGRQIVKLPRVLHLIERRDQIDAKGIRDNLRTSGLILSTDRLLTSPKRQNAIPTQQKKYTLFEAGADGKIGAHMNVLTSFKEDDKGKKTGSSGSALDLEGGIGGKYQREGFVSGTSFRTRISSLRLHSNRYLADEIEAMKQRLPQKLQSLKGLKTEEGDVSQLAKELDTQLKSLEDLYSGDESKTSDKEWRDVALSLNLLACHFVRLENRIKAEIIRAEDRLAAHPENERLKQELAGHERNLADLKTFFEKRLSSPEIAMPQKIFEETMLDRVAAEKNKYSTYSGHVTFGYTVGTGLITQEIKEQSPGFLDSSNMTAQNTFANAAIGSGVGATGDILGLSNKVDGQLSIKKAHEDNDLRPWMHGRTMTLSLKLDSHMPVRQVLEMFAEKYVDSFGEADHRPTKGEVVREMLLEFAMAVGVGSVVQGAIGSLVGVPLMDALKSGKAPGPLLDFLGKPFVEASTGVMQYTGIDVGMSMEFSRTVEWQWSNGRLICMALHDEQSSSQKIGARFQVLPNAGAGFYLESGGSLDRIMRVGYAKPPVNAILSRTEDLLGTGSAEPLKAFYAHNKKGLLRLYDVFRDANVTALQSKYDAETDEKVPDKYTGDQKHFLQDRKSFLGHLTTLTQAFARIEDTLSAREQDDAKRLDFTDRVAVAREGLLRAVKVMGDDHQTDAQKLNALRQLMTAIVRGYGLALEATESLGIKDLAYSGDVNIPIPQPEVEPEVEHEVGPDVEPQAEDKVEDKGKVESVPKPATKGIETGVVSSTYFNLTDGQDYTFNEFTQDGGVVNDVGQQQCFFLSSLRFLSDPRINLGTDGQSFQNAKVDLNDSARLRTEMGKVVNQYLDQHKDKETLDPIDGFVMDDLRKSVKDGAFLSNSTKMADLPTAVVLAHMLQRPVVMVTQVGNGTTFMTCTTDLLTNKKLPDREPVYIHYANKHFQAMELRQKSGYQGLRPFDYLLQNFNPTLRELEEVTHDHFDRIITSHNPPVQSHDDEQNLVRRLEEIAGDSNLKAKFEEIFMKGIEQKLDLENARILLDEFLFGNLDSVRKATNTYIQAGTMQLGSVIYP